jgi:hypothetical protein
MDGRPSSRNAKPVTPIDIGAGRRRLRRLGLWAAPLMILPLAGCLDLDSTAPPPQFIWQAQLTPLVEPEEISFSADAAMITGRGRTELGVTIRNADPGTEFHWWVRSNRCDSSGAPLGQPGAFPPFEADDLGGGSAVTQLGGNVSPELNYAAELFTSDGILIACGNLTR